MGRLLFFLAVAVLVYLVYKSWQRKQLPNKNGDNPRAGNKLNQDPREAICPCLHCGAYSPLSDGVMVQGRFYCNVAHAKQEGEKVG